MTHFTAILLGVVEGATEFIPVSSSGHLILVRQLLGLNDSAGLSFDAILQLATTFALVVYFWKDLWRLFITFLNILTGKNEEKESKTLLCSIALGTIPAVIFGLLLEKEMDTIFRSAKLVTLTLVLGSLLMYFAQRFSDNNLSKNSPLIIIKGFVVGLFQCLALVPGVSRSGATISGGLFAGLSREDAVRFSFLLSVPILVGSGLKKLVEVRSELFTTGLGINIFFGSLSAFVVGLFAISFLIKYLKNHNLNSFIYYRIALAIAILIFFYN